MKVIVPVGTGLPLMSVTVAVHVEAWFTTTVAGLHERPVVVGLRLIVSAAELLPGPAALVAVTTTVNPPDEE